MRTAGSYEQTERRLGDDATTRKVAWAYVDAAFAEAPCVSGAQLISELRRLDAPAVLLELVQAAVAGGGSTRPELLRDHIVTLPAT